MADTRKLKTIRKIQRAYMELVVSRTEVSSINVSDVCKKAQINRTTFYSHFIDLQDLKDSIQDWMISEFLDLFKEEIETRTHSYDFYKLFKNIKENQIFYKVYFKLEFDFKKIFLQGADRADLARSYRKDIDNTDYHIEFFAGGITALVRKWLDEGCPGSPENMAHIIETEYRSK